MAPSVPRERTFTISELAGEFAITTRTIRFYESVGLLAPARRGQARIFSAADRTTIKLILRGKRLGFSLQESRELIGLYDPAEGNMTQLETLLRRLAEKRSVLAQQLIDIRAMQAELDDVERRCQRALTAAKRPQRSRSVAGAAEDREAATPHAQRALKAKRASTRATKVAAPVAKAPRAIRQPRPDDSTLISAEVRTRVRTNTTPTRGTHR